jgi:hypothetical protein
MAAKREKEEREALQEKQKQPMTMNECLAGAE